MKTTILLFLCVSFLMIAGCSIEVDVYDTDNITEKQIEDKEEIIDEEIEEFIEVEVVEEKETEEKPECTKNADCKVGLKCIDNRCQKLAELYVTEGCTKKCKVAEVSVVTSDGETYTLRIGQGSYSYAGALEWKLRSTPEYCQGEKPLVPILLIKKSYGKVLEQELITLKEGMKSKEITHPVVSRVKFTATLEDVSESCS